MMDRGHHGRLVVFQDQLLKRDLIEYVIPLRVMMAQRHTDAHQTVSLKKQKPKTVPLQRLYAIMEFVRVKRILPKRQKNEEMDQLKVLVPHLKHVTLMVFAKVRLEIEHC